MSLIEDVLKDKSWGDDPVRSLRERWEASLHEEFEAEFGVLGVELRQMVEDLIVELKEAQPE